MQFNLGLTVTAIIGIAIMVVGFTEWLKGLWQKLFGVTIPGWVPSALPLLACLALAALVAPLVGLLGLWWVAVGLMALAVTELCYQLLVQSIPQVVAGAISAATGQQVQPPVSEPVKTQGGIV